MKFRKAKREDLEIIVEMLADDEFGSKREDYQIPLPTTYLRAFERIITDPSNELIVATDQGLVLGTLQLTFIPYLTFKGGLRAQIEAVRVHKDYRNLGLGKKFFEWAIERAKEKGCHMVQLTTNKERNKTKDFYNALGFESSHEGMKLYLKPW